MSFTGLAKVTSLVTLLMSADTSRQDWHYDYTLVGTATRDNIVLSLAGVATRTTNAPQKGQITMLQSHNIQQMCCIFTSVLPHVVSSS